METELCDLMRADELGQIMPDYPEGYIVISAGGAASTEFNWFYRKPGCRMRELRPPKLKWSNLTSWVRLFLFKQRPIPHQYWPF